MSWVLVVVIDCTVMGASPPTSREPTWILRVGRRGARTGAWARTVGMPRAIASVTHPSMASGRWAHGTAGRDHTVASVPTARAPGGPGYWSVEGSGRSSTGAREQNRATAPAAMPAAMTIREMLNATTSSTPTAVSTESTTL